MIQISLITINKENFYVFLIWKEKTKYYANLRHREQKNLENYKACFSDKPKISERIFLIQNDEMVLEDGKHLF